MTAQDVKEYFAQSPLGAQRLINDQRELAHRYGPPSVAFQDIVAMQVRSFLVLVPCISLHSIPLVPKITLFVLCRKGRWHSGCQKRLLCKHAHSKIYSVYCRPRLCLRLPLVTGESPIAALKIALPCHATPFKTVPHAKIFYIASGDLPQAADRARKELESTVRRKIPRLPIFLLPSRYSFPRRSNPGAGGSWPST